MESLLPDVQTLPENQHGSNSSGMRSRNPSSASKRSMQEYGGMYVKRLSRTATTDEPFIRRSSTISKVPSGKSISSKGSIRTRLASVSRADYHTDLKPSLSSGATLNLLSTAFIILFGCSFLFGFNIGSLNPISNLIKIFYMETYTNRSGGTIIRNGTNVDKWVSSVIPKSTLTILWSLTTAIYLPGGMVGAMLAGFFADRIGRKKTILFSHIFAFVASILAAVCQVAKSPELLMLSRLIQGFNCGLGGTIAPMYLSEISTFNLRGALGTAHQLFVTIGIFMGSVFGLDSVLGTQELWPYILMMNAFPALVSLIILPFLPDSPRYLLLLKNQREDAQKALRFFRNTDEVTADMEEMDTEHQQSTEIETYTLRKLLTTIDLRPPLILAVMLQVIQQFSGINAVFFFSGSIFKNAGVQVDQIPYAILAVNAVNVFMTIISVPLMDRVGRRPLLLYPMIGMVIVLVLITISLNLQKLPCCTIGMSYVSIGSVVLYVIFFAIGLGPIPWLIVAELFRQGPRPKAMAVAGVTNWVGTFIIAIAFESVQEALKEFTFLVFLVLMIGFTVFVYFKVPETKNKTFEEIAHQFAPGGDIEVEEMMDDEEDVFDDIPDAPDDPEEHRLVTMDLSNRDHSDVKTPDGIQLQELGESNTDETQPLKRDQ